LSFTISPALKNARTEFDKARTEHSRITAALVVAKNSLREAEANFQGAQASLAAGEAGAALGDAPTATPTRKNFLMARDQIDFIQARITGLEGNLKIAEDSIAVAGKALAVAFEAWKKQLEDELAAEYDAALQQFMSVVDRGLALSASLNSGRITMALRRVVAPGNIHGSVRPILRSGMRRTQYLSVPEFASLASELAQIRRQLVGDITDPMAHDVRNEVEVVG
jgi:hypothetical protein